MYDKETPVAEADFFYKPNVVIFVDGDPHEKDYVKKADETKRDKLRALGYTVVSIKNIEDVEGLRKYID